MCPHKETFRCTAGSSGTFLVLFSARPPGGGRVLHLLLPQRPAQPRLAGAKALARFPGCADVNSFLPGAEERPASTLPSPGRPACQRALGAAGRVPGQRGIRARAPLLCGAAVTWAPPTSSPLAASPRPQLPGGGALGGGRRLGGVRASILSLAPGLGVRSPREHLGPGPAWPVGGGHRGPLDGHVGLRAGRRPGRSLTT